MNSRTPILPVAVGLLALAAMALLTPGPSVMAKGGWAVSSLDEIPEPAAGDSVEVGFTIRQHGVTPVDLEGVGIRIVGADGATELFTARHDGPTGHYLVDVVFPHAGTYRWVVEQGWFADHDLGEIQVVGGGSSGAGSSVGSWAAYGLAGSGVVGVLVILDLRVSRRRRLQRA